MEDDETVDAWGDLGARYRYDSHAQFVLFIEQLAVARELLEAGTLSKHRMALVAVDNLAELVLYRHKRRLTEAAQESYRDVEPRLDINDENRFRASFTKRVDLGLKGPGSGLLEFSYQPVLDQLDAGLFRVGHRYRNRAYHADHHNTAALELVAKAYFAAVARAFARLQPRNVAGSMSEWTSKVLRDYGYDGAKSSWPSAAEMLAPAEAAEAIMGRLTDGVQVSLSPAKSVLIGDLRRRVVWVREMIRSLLTDGMPQDRLEFGLRWTFVWRDISLDPEVVELERQMQALWRDRIDGTPESVSPDEYFERDAELNERRNARVKDLLASPNAKTFNLPERVGQIEARIRRVERARNLTRLVDGYERLDTAVEEIEEILDEAAIGWDRWVQSEVDRLRGK